MVELQEEENLVEETKPIINLSSLAFEQLLTLGVDVNHLFVLEAVKEGTDLSLHIKSPKLEGWKQTLIRKGYLNMQGQITSEGVLLLSLILEGQVPTIQKRKRERKEVILTDFEK